MGRYVLKNNVIEIAVDSFGAELKSLKKCGNKSADSKEYMWCADPAYWGRTSPVLFPFVGSVRNKTYRTKGTSYNMGQHGFARDMEFTLSEQKDDEIWFILDSNEETLAKYPYEFRLKIGYKIINNSIVVMWKVSNSGNETMPFSIGAHPAFFCPVDSTVRQSDCFIKFDADRIISRSLENGLVSPDKCTEFVLDNGYLPIDEHLFDKDALIIENNQAHIVSLCGPDKKPYITVKMQAPLFGVWSPASKNAPFVCIEPWYGRCDRSDFDGDLSEREWGQLLKAGDTFSADYTIICE